MKNYERAYNITFGQVYPLYIAKIERKARKKEELDTILNWLTGYTITELEELGASEVTLREFFEKALNLTPDRHKITGSICGVKIQEIQEPLMKEIRYMDKIVDQLAQGKKIEKIINL